MVRTQKLFPKKINSDDHFDPQFLLMAMKGKTTKPKEKEKQ
jgi:hypothetical protein